MCRKINNTYQTEIQPPIQQQSPTEKTNHNVEICVATPTIQTQSIANNCNADANLVLYFKVGAALHEQTHAINMTIIGGPTQSSVTDLST